MILRAGPLDMLEIDAHAERLVLLRDHDDIGEPVGVVDLADKLSFQEPSHFLADCLSFLHSGPTEMFLYGLHFWVDSQTVLSQSPGYTWHVGRFPCEDVPVLMEELDERFFLFAVECS